VKPQKDLRPFVVPSTAAQATMVMRATPTDVIRRMKARHLKEGNISLAETSVTDSIGVPRYAALEAAV
jgi:hypothetical protein